MASKTKSLDSSGVGPGFAQEHTKTLLLKKNQSYICKYCIFLSLYYYIPLVPKSVFLKTSSFPPSLQTHTYAFYIAFTYYYTFTLSLSFLFTFLFYYFFSLVPFCSFSIPLILIPFIQFSSSLSLLPLSLCILSLIIFLPLPCSTSFFFSPSLQEKKTPTDTITSHFHSSPQCVSLFLVTFLFISFYVFLFVAKSL